MPELPVTEAMQHAFINGSDQECEDIAACFAQTFGLNKNEVYMFLVNLYPYVAGYVQDKKELHHENLSHTQR